MRNARPNCFSLLPPIRTLLVSIIILMQSEKSAGAYCTVKPGTWRFVQLIEAVKKPGQPGKHCVTMTRFSHLHRARMLFEFTLIQVVLTAIVFVWTGFVRSGLGFGGAALGLPLLLFIDDRPLLWLPVIGAHLLFFSSLTLRTQLKNVDWAYLRKAAIFVIPAALVGVLGLIKLPNEWLLIIIYSVSLFYGFLWLTNIAIHSGHNWVDKCLLVLGGYFAGMSLTGAPIMIAVFMRNIARTQLRNTLFVLWFIIVSIKMTTFVTLGIELNLPSALLLLPVAAIGHFAGLKAHDYLLRNDRRFRTVIGGSLMLISVIGLWLL
jgi:uncharacterized membrane protein YfcA